MKIGLVILSGIAIFLISQSIRCVGKWAHSQWLIRKKHIRRGVKKCYRCKKQVYWWQAKKILTWNLTPVHNKCYVKAKKDDSLPKSKIFISQRFN